jgi:predicted HTH domain antitoxin
MTEVSISARIPKELEEELEEFIKREKVDRSIAIRKLLDSGLHQWKEEKALRMLEKGEITFSKAAKLADMDVWSFADKVKESGIVWVKMKPDELRKELKQL